MLLNPLEPPSTTYMAAPRITASTNTAPMNTDSLRRLSRMASSSTSASPVYSTSFSTRKTRSTRSTRMIWRVCAPGITRLRKVGTMEARSTSPKKLAA